MTEPNFVELLNNFVNNTVQVSLPSFLPELVLSATIVAMLLLRVLSFNRATEALARFVASWLPLVGAVAALAVTEPWTYFTGHPPAADKALGGELFTGMLAYDTFTIYFRSILLFFVVLFVLFTQLSGIPDKEDAADFYTLILGSTIGMCLMASANHLLIVFLGVEMASVPSYALAGMLKGRRQASEAALKYAVYGAGAAGVMLYGISLLAGIVGTCHMPTMAARLGEMIQSGEFADRYTVLVLGGLMIMAGLAFKLSAVPFHFWCPDVFEGASAEVDAFLSVASKAAALALLVRVGLGLAYVPASYATVAAPAAETAPSESSAGVARSPFRLVNVDVTVDPDAGREAEPAEHPAPAQLDVAALNKALAPVRSFAAWTIAFLAAITCTFGNLAAYGQSNIKRLLAYSTIAHAGYLMMPVSAALVLAGDDPAAAAEAISGMLFYLAAYLFMNLGAFAIVAFLRNAMHSEEIRDYAGLFGSAPGVVILFSIILLSLVGLPPFVGFIAKVGIFYPLIAAQQYTLLLIGGLNTVLSLFYYLRVVKTMTLDPAPEQRLPVQFSMISLAGVYVALVSLPVVVLGIWMNSLLEWSRAAAAGLVS